MIGTKERNRKERMDGGHRQQDWRRDVLLTSRPASQQPEGGSQELEGAHEQVEKGGQGEKLAAHHPRPEAGAPRSAAASTFCRSFCCSYTVHNTNQSLLITLVSANRNQTAEELSSL